MELQLFERLREHYQAAIETADELSDYDAGRAERIREVLEKVVHDVLGRYTTPEMRPEGERALNRVDTRLV